MSKKVPLVSILTPCYNSEKYILRMLDSILKQTYPNIELICIDDGSTDKTEKIIKEYIPIFESNGKTLVYLYKEHKGQAAAVNAGLKIINGAYFGLLDSDDYLVDESIEKRVAALEENPNYGVVASDYFIVDENDLETVIGLGNDYIGNLCYQPYQFYLALEGYSAVTPLGYLIRTDDMRKINPQMNINECREGQNYQLLLPLYYHYKRLFIDEPLGYYVVRNDSHGHMKRSQREMNERYTRLLQMLEEVLLELKMPYAEIQKCLKISSFNNNLENI